MSVLLLQARPEDAAADEEYAAILSRGGLSADAVRRVRLERDDPGPLDGVRAVVMGGGPACVSDADPNPMERAINDRARAVLAVICTGDIPFLGLCYGIGALAAHLGGRVDKSAGAEGIGPTALTVTDAGRADPLLKGVPDRFDALVAHKEAVQGVPAGATLLVGGSVCPVQMIRAGRHVYATQFHPEADGHSFAFRVQVYRDRGYFDVATAEALQVDLAGVQTPHSERILRNFIDRYAR